MLLAPGTRLGPYEVVAKLGEGGMGEVYRARDTKLGRDVALKILSEAFAADPDRLMRFEREARTLASLNHPNIAQVYGVEDFGSADLGQRAGRALVMELVEGEGLDEKIAAAASPQPAPGRRLPLDDTLAIARQIADALEAAHEAGIIHRDLKPANVKVRPDGAVKVLDFGLAKAVEQASGSRLQASRELPDSPTITSPALTMRGVILGTAAYMAPEQARGRVVDKRADIWAFGCVLYEMLAGARAFDGDDIADTMVSVLSTEPDWDRLPTATPGRVRHVLRRCLQKDPRKRLRDIGDVRVELDEAEDGEGSAAGTVPMPLAPGASRREWVAWGLAAVLGIALAMMAVERWSSSEPSPSSDDIVRFTIAPPDQRIFSGQPSALSFAPDGRTLAFATADMGGGGLWVRPLHALESRQLPVGGPVVTWASAAPAWSPDGRSLAITAGTVFGGPVRKVDLEGGPITTLAEWGRDAHWTAGGGVLYTGRDDRVHRVAETGGTSAPVTTLDAEAGEIGHTVTAVLPDGERFVFLAENRVGAKTATYVGSLGSASRILVPDVSGRVRYAAGYLWFLRDSTLVRQAFDVGSVRPTGEVEPVAEDVDIFAVSPSGTVVTRSRDRSGLDLSWLDESGKPGSTVGPSGSSRLFRPDLSPDGRLLALSRPDAQGSTDIWIVDLERNVPTRLTSGPADDEAPLFSPDGAFVVFASDRGGAFDLYRRAVDGRGQDELLLQSSEAKFPSGFSSDGRVLLYRDTGPDTGADVWALSLDGDRTPRPLVKTPALEGYATFSPDGRWIAYCSSETGEPDQVYVEPYPPTGARIRLSTTHGASPQWSASGREVFYGTRDNQVMRVEVTPGPGTLKAGAPRLLVTAPMLFFHSGFVLDRARVRVLTPTGSQASAGQSLTVTMRVSSGSAPTSRPR